MTSFGKIGLNAASKVFCYFLLLGCHPPDLEAVAQAIFALALQLFSIFVQFNIADFWGEMTRKEVAKARGVSCITKLVAGGLKEVK